MKKDIGCRQFGRRIKPLRNNIPFLFGCFHSSSFFFFAYIMSFNERLKLKRVFRSFVGMCTDVLRWLVIAGRRLNF
ncbi:hypothetical protein LguiA_001948 [Lonicera macranthoides]